MLYPGKMRELKNTSAGVGALIYFPQLSHHFVKKEKNQNKPASLQTLLPYGPLRAQE